MEVYEKRKNATRYVYPLSPKKVIKKTVSLSVGLITGYLISVGILYITFLYMKYSSMWELLIVLVLPSVFPIPFIYKYEQLYYKTYYYDLLPDMLIIRKGVWMPREIRIPYSKIQNVYVDRNLFDVIYGLYDVHLATADTSSQFYAHIDGVNEKNAATLRELILKKTKEASTTTNSGV